MHVFGFLRLCGVNPSLHAPSVFFTDGLESQIHLSYSQMGDGGGDNAK
jgi:hypothetical protein